VRSELEALLVVQDEDEKIREVRSELEALAPRVRELDRELEAENAAAARATQETEAELERRKTLAARLAEHRRMHERNIAQLDQVKRIRDATAAQAQVDMARRILSDEEVELENLDLRLKAIRERVEEHQARHAELLESQKPEREKLMAERKALEKRADELRAARAEMASGISPSLLHRYERIATRARGRAVFALRGLSCGACDTAIPLQRRNAMIAGAIDLCETCGMMLFAAPAKMVEDGETRAEV